MLSKVTFSLMSVLLGLSLIVGMHGLLVKSAHAHQVNVDDGRGGTVRAYHTNNLTDAQGLHRHASATDGTRTNVTDPTDGGGGGTPPTASAPAAAGVIVSPNLNHNRDRSGEVDTSGGLAYKGFVVYEPSGNPDNKIADSVHIVSAGTSPAPQFPDLYDLLAVGGGTIELIVKKSPDVPGPETLTTVSDRGLAITEIMWAYDEAQTGAARLNLQWIEIYSAVSITLGNGDRVRLLFTPNRQMIRSEVTFKVANVGSAGADTEDVSPGPYTPSTATGAVDVVYTVVDRISVQNRFGIQWTLKGSHGRTAPSTTGDSDAPAKNAVSMYRKRSVNDDRTDYRYKGTIPDGGFGLGYEAGQWFASVGRLNIQGYSTGTPGAVQQEFGGMVTSGRNPASLPVGSVIINEIFNSETLQWVELHNTGSSEVNVKNYELEAVYGDKKLQRVFTVPNKDTKIPAGGFLLITTRDPAKSVLAGGTDLYDNNRFPSGAKQLYIVVPKAGDNKWMPEKNFLLLLRTENKDNHEKVVDLAGNYFITSTGSTLVTDVWPLIGWTVPPDNERDNNDWGGANNSLIRNPNRTYARIEQKSGGNRVHKDHWRMDGPVGGLGYDPKVDLEMAPGTPGYANNGQKNNLASISSEIATKVVISEIMYDPGDDGRLAQWIELYNSSLMHSVSLQNWKLEIRNRDTDVQSYVDSNFKFDSDAIILPNQTLLLVSDRSNASDVPKNRVYNLYQKHRGDLGLSNRRSILLSGEGFYLRLLDKDNKEVDVVGNITLDGPRRKVVWDLPETSGEIRRSIVRQFGSRKRDGSADAANDGEMMKSWNVAQSVGSHYGHRSDIGSPGHRDGSPLPVSLSSFRPVRDASTGAVVIRWTTESELNNAGFNILRSDAKDGEFTVVNVKGLITGHGTTSEKHTYEWTDTTAKPNVVYYYQLEDVSLDGQRTTLRTTHLRGNVTASGKLTTVWGDLKFQK